MVSIEVYLIIFVNVYYINVLVYFNFNYDFKLILGNLKMLWKSFIGIRGEKKY